MKKLLKPKIGRIIDFEKIADLFDAAREIQTSFETGDFIWLTVILIMTVGPTVQRLFGNRKE